MSLYLLSLYRSFGTRSEKHEIWTLESMYFLIGANPFVFCCSSDREFPYHCVDTRPKVIGVKGAGFSTPLKSSVSPVPSFTSRFLRTGFELETNELTLKTEWNL